MENHYFKSTFKLKLAKVITSNGKSNKIITLNPKLAKHHYFR